MNFSSSDDVIESGYCGETLHADDSGDDEDCDDDP